MRNYDPDVAKQLKEIDSTIGCAAAGICFTLLFIAAILSFAIIALHQPVKELKKPLQAESSEQ